MFTRIYKRNYVSVLLMMMLMKAAAVVHKTRESSGAQRLSSLLLFSACTQFVLHELDGWNKII
jgi:hypothetical protein